MVSVNIICIWILSEVSSEGYGWGDDMMLVLMFVYVGN